MFERSARAHAFPAAVLVLAAAADCLAAAGNVDLPRFPSISPDGSQIVFSWRGDLWKVPSTGGQAVRLTSHPGDDLRSAWSPDGSRIAFDSDRSGFLNIHTMKADGTDVRQLTRIDRPCTLTGFGVDADGKPVITFTAALEADLYRSPRPYMISTDGGELRRLHDAFGSEARVSPDGSRIVFTRGYSSWDRRNYRGSDNREVWTFRRSDGSFARLTQWAGNDGDAMWAGPNTLLFLSDRQHDRVNIYRMSADAGEAGAAALTEFKDADLQDFDVSADGSKAVLGVWDTLYTLDLKSRTAQPKPLTITANEDEADNFQLKSINREVSEAALNPDGKVMAYVSYGEVYVRHVDDKSPTRRVTSSHAREKDIAWSPDGLKLYFVSDSDGTESIYAATVGLTRDQIKEEFEKSLAPPEPEPAPEQPAAEPAAEPQAEPPPAEPAPEPAPPPQPEAAANQPEPPVTEPPAAHEDKPADDAKDKADGKEKKKPKDPKLDPDRWHDAVTFEIAPVVKESTNDRAPSPSPDGKWLAFRRGRGDLMILELESSETRRLAGGWDPGLHWQWSPNSRWIAYAISDMDFNSDIWIVPADGSSMAVNVTRHPDNDENPRWSADCRILSFVSERVNEEYDVWTVYLDKKLEAKTPAELEKYYKDAADAVKKRKPLPVKDPKAEDEKNGKDKKDAKDNGADAKKEDKDKSDKKEKKDEGIKSLDLDDAYLRLRRITSLEGNETDNQLTPAGDLYIFSATIGGSTDLYSVKWDGTDRKKLTGRASVQHLTLTGDNIVFVAEGRAGTVKPTGGEVKYYDIADRMRIDLQQQSSQKFLEAARILGEIFYHPTMKDTDWPALTEKYHALARQARTASEFNSVAARFIGELNASHLGISARSEPSPNRQESGRLGTIHQRQGDGFVILEIVPESPAAKGPTQLKIGDVIIAVEEQPFVPDETVESRLAGRVDQETILTVRRTLDDGQQKELRCLITPTSFGAESALKYDAYQRRTSAKVAEWSDGRVGYIHIAGMDQGSLDEFERDLYAAAADKKGLIIDVRNNGGGWTADRLLSSIMVQQHAYTIPRGADPSQTGHYPQDRLFIQRYTLPINMLCNEKSFSNAEIISHAFQTLKRGTLVGQQTYGGVISTGGTSLIDGTFVRLPSRGWFLPDGTDMENHGATPEILVPQTPEAESRNDDEQLKAAVDDLMKRLN